MSFALLSKLFLYEFRFCVGVGLVQMCDGPAGSPPLSNSSSSNLDRLAFLSLLDLLVCLGLNLSGWSESGIELMNLNSSLSYLSVTVWLSLPSI